MELMPTAFKQFRGKRALKTVFEILKPLYISRRKSLCKFIALSKNIFNMSLAQT